MSPSELQLKRSETEERLRSQREKNWGHLQTLKSRLANVPQSYSHLILHHDLCHTLEPLLGMDNVEEDD